MDSGFINLLSANFQKTEVRIQEKGESNALPQRIHCKKCGEVLYEDMELKPPHEIVQRYDGRCPSCGRKLSSIPIKVIVKRIR